MYWKGDAHLKHASRLAKLDLPHLAQVQSALLGLLASTAAAVAPEPAPALAPEDGRPVSVRRLLAER